MQVFKPRHHWITPQLIALATFAGAACGDAGQQTDRDTGTIEGRVADDSQNFTTGLASVEGSVITAYRIEASGDLEVVSRESATVDADGRYAIEVDMQAAAGAALLIRAEDEASGELVGKVAISESFRGEASMTAPTIDAESTVIADLYLGARASGSISAEVGPGMFYLMADAELAAELSGARDADLRAAAEAMAAAVAAWEAALVHESTGAAEQDAEAALRFAAEAEAELASELAAGNKNAAFAAYAEAVLEAHADAGIDARYVARAAIASAEVMKAYAGSLSGQARAKVTVSAEAHKARMVTQSLVARAEAELSAAASAIADAGATLQAEIRAAAEASAGAEAAIAEAWASFQADVEAEVAAALDGAEAEVEALVAAMEDAAAALASSFGDLSGSLSIGVNVEVAVSGMADFFAAAEAEAETLLDLGLAAGEVEAAVEILATIVACAA